MQPPLLASLRSVARPVASRVAVGQRSFSGSPLALDQRAESQAKVANATQSASLRVRSLSAELSPPPGDDLRSDTIASPHAAGCRTEAEKTFGRFWKTVNLKETPEGPSPTAPTARPPLPVPSWPTDLRPDPLRPPLWARSPDPVGYQVLLDARPLKTPGGKALWIPSEKRALAYLIAAEWDNQRQVLKGHALPMVPTLFFPLTSRAPFLFEGG